MPLIGVFPARGPNRPNPIGVSACEIVELGDTWLSVRGLDAIDGTPVLDLKPVMAVLVPRATREPEWSSRLMADYYTGSG
jgi:tRNA (adenine37-N6)-methyltransferase